MSGFGFDIESIAIVVTGVVVAVIILFYIVSWKKKIPHK